MTNPLPICASVPLALRSKEAARALHISERKLWEMTNRGQIPHLRVGRVLLYPIAAIEKWLADESVKGVRE